MTSRTTTEIVLANDLLLKKAVRSFAFCFLRGKVFDKHHVFQYHRYSEQYDNMKFSQIGENI